MTCSAATPKLTEEEIRAALSRLVGWSHLENSIEKQYEFTDFLRAMSFVNAVACVAEAIRHHPDIIVRYNKVTLRIWTHAAGGITEYDFALAQKIDAIIETEGSS